MMVMVPSASLLNKRKGEDGNIIHTDHTLVMEPRLYSPQKILDQPESMSPGVQITLQGIYQATPQQLVSLTGVLILFNGLFISKTS